MLINLEALSHFGPPCDPRREPRIVSAMRRIRDRALLCFLIVWEIFVGVALVVGVTSHGTSPLAPLLLSSLLASGAGIAAVLAIRSKLRDHELGREPNRTWAMGVSWSTRWLITGLVGMAIGAVALLAFGR